MNQDTANNYTEQQTIMNYETCSFTGHREGLNDLNLEFLNKLIEDLILNGTHTFYCGMAQGFDLIAGESVVQFKKKYPHVKLIACLPHAEQRESMKGIYRDKWDYVAQNADEIVNTTNLPHFYRGCMQKRNRYLVDHAQIVLAYLRKQEGGTKQTVDLAKKRNIPVIFV